MIVRILLALIIVSLMVPVLAVGCSENKINAQEVDMIPGTIHPAIDANVPATFETATFALG